MAINAPAQVSLAGQPSILGRPRSH